MATIHYRVDGGAWTLYSGPFFIATFGPHTLAYRATDVAGNVEATKTESWGTDFDAGEQLDGLSDFIDRLGLEKSLAKDLQHKLEEAGKKLAKPSQACDQLDVYVDTVIDSAGVHNPKLTYVQAEQLLSVYQIEVLIGCIPATSPIPAAQIATLELGRMVNGFGLEDGTADGLRNEIRQVGKKLIGGQPKDICQQLAQLSKKIDDAAKKNKLTAGQATQLSGAASDIGTPFGC